MRALRKLPWRRLGRAAAAFAALCLLFAAALFLYGRAADRRWAAWRAQAAAKGLNLDSPYDRSADIPDRENLAAPGGPFATVSVDGSSKPGERRDWLGDLSWAPIGIFPDISKGVCVDWSKAAVWQPRPVRRVSSDSAPARTGALPKGPAEFLEVFDQWIGPEWAQVREAERKPKTSFHPPLEPALTRQVSALRFRKAVQLHTARSLALLAADRGSEALEEIRGGLRLARALEEGRDDTLVPAMVRLAVIHVLMTPVWEGLADDRWSDADLAALASELEAMRPASQWLRIWDAEAVFSTTFLEQMEKQPASERLGNLRKHLFRRNGPDWANVETDLASFSKGLVRDNEIALCEWLLGARSLMGADGQLRPAGPAAFDLNTLTASPRFSNCIARMMAPAAERAVMRMAISEARVRQARIAVALERFRRAHGVLPETLDSLTPALLPAVPLDPVDGRPMRYARKDDGGCRLWSIGSDRVDDGGVPMQQEDPSEKLDVVWEGLPPRRAEEAPKTARR